MKHKMLVALLAAVVPLLGNGLAVAIWLPLLEVPRGSYIRPMLQCGQELVVDVLTFFVGVPLGVALLARRRRLAGWACIAFSCTPLFVGLVTCRIISDARDLHWAE